jgi:hypothetical protein
VHPSLPPARLATALAAAVVAGLCGSACSSSPKTAPQAADTGHPATVIPLTPTSRPSAGSPSASPNASASPSPSPAQSTQDSAAAGAAPTAAETIAAVVNHTTAPALPPPDTAGSGPASNSTPYALVGHMQQFPTQTTYDIPINYGIDNPSTQTVCADGAPTITFEYLDSSDAWATATLTGTASTKCAPADNETFIGTAFAIETAYNDDYQAKIISITWELTGPDGAWQASG